MPEKQGFLQKSGVFDPRRAHHLLKYEEHLVTIGFTVGFKVSADTEVRLQTEEIRRNPKLNWH